MTGSKYGPRFHLQIMVHDVQPVTADVGERIALFGPSEDVGGDWTLKLTDAATPDEGTLTTWCLIPTTSGGGGGFVIFKDGFE